MGRVTLDAFVVRAAGPDAGWTTGRQELTMAVRLPSGAVVEVADDPKAKVEQWIVRGMTVPVSIDPDKPKRCDVLMDAIPPLTQRMAERDWALCRLEEVAAQVRLAKYDLERAQASAGAMEGAFAQAREVEEQRLLAAAREQVASRPAERTTDSNGRIRGTADLISYERKPSSRNNPGDNAGWKGRRLLRVWPLGGEPYAVMDEVKFSLRGRECFLAGGGVPVSIDPADPSDVKVLWDEHTYDPAAERERMIGGEVAGAMQQAAQLQAAGLQAAFAATPPEMRAALADQLRAAGMDVPDELA